MNPRILTPQKPKVLEREDNRALIEISELYPGYGDTLGNSLRRVLLSSLEGAAITTVKIEGALHEFSTLDNVLEDVLDISFNLKGVRIILHDDEAQTIKLSAKGKKSVKAKDIKTPSQVEIVNPDVHIATLTSASAKLDMEFQVEKGIGYQQSDKESKDKKEVGVIRLDAIFSPILNVNFEVENMRVGDRTDYNRLLINIKTDGTISPEDAYEKAVSLLIDNFTVVSEIENKQEEKKKVAKKKASKKSEE